MNASPFLRRALLLDAAASGATGALMLLAASPLAELTLLPPGLLRAAGAVLIPYTAFVLWLGRHAAPPRGLVRAVVAINLLWTVESVAILALGWVSPNALGTAFVLAQALAVLAFAGLQAAGLRGAAPLPA
ncbi:hypothetical protein EAH89_12215 [Roseomonas nepalensis]|uniref:Integral membrane protein n=1 Tax=Muricoccus nepalensis TaxID=1854500 RepID=A0A502G5T9_9PROT|nr:hypothetical protein [Roseomonas nepalensis]TPG57209.1 hypothetical protein EAH89_12215 [Roseomonas nepalensis]